MSVPLRDHPEELLPWYVNGTLEGAERERVAEHLGSCLVCRREVAELETLRREVRESAVGEPPGEAGLDRLMRAATARPAPTPPWRRPWLLAAAVATLVAGAFLLQPQRDLRTPEYREARESAIRSLVADDILSRDDVVLRWMAEPGLEVASWNVRVTSETLEPIYERRDLDAPELQLPAEALATLPSGAKLYWQVEAVLEDGERLRSPTFRARLE